MKHIVFTFNDESRNEIFEQTIDALDMWDEFRRCGHMSWYISIPQEAEREESERDVEGFLMNLGLLRDRDYEF